MHSIKLLWAANNEEKYNRRQTRLVRRQMEKIQEMPDSLFRERFRFNKETYRQLCSDLRRLTPLKGSREIPLQIKVLCALSFYATGSYQRIVGITQHLTQRTTSRCIKQVTYALTNRAMLKKWIVSPQSQQERSRLKLEFQRKFQLPGVIGCIDCTHIAIVKPNEEEHLFFNRKGYHSLNVQMICDSNLRIMNVNANFGGATHDAYIWASSQAEVFMRHLHRNGEQVWLLGDSGYPQRPWLMTPILDAAAGSREEIYTRRHIRARNCIERCYGVLKSRWRCLLKDRSLHYHPHVASRITMACCVLHNIALSARLPPPEVLVLEEDANVEEDLTANISLDSQSELLQGRATLNSLILRLQ